MNRVEVEFAGWARYLQRITNLLVAMEDAGDIANVSWGLRVVDIETLLLFYAYPVMV